MLKYVCCRTSKAPGQPPQQINVDRFVRSLDCVARVGDILRTPAKHFMAMKSSRPITRRELPRKGTIIKREKASLSSPRRPANRSTRLPCLSRLRAEPVSGHPHRRSRRSVSNRAFLNALCRRASFAGADREERIGIRGGAYGAMNGGSHSPDDGVLHLLVCQYCSNIQQQQDRLARAARPHRDCLPARWREVTSSLCLR